MDYRILGKTGARVSVVGVGAWQFGGEWGKAYTPGEVEAILDKAEALGINLVDTAECYGPDHLSEALLGPVLARRRDRWFVATKFGHAFEGHNRRAARWSVPEVVAQLEASLRALRTDHVDLYQFHSGPDSEYHRDDLWSALRKQVEAGKVRHLGVSISSQSENLGQVEAAPAYGIGVIQLVYNRLDRVPEARVLPACERLGLGVLARSPLAGGFLSGKYRPGDTFPADDVRASSEPRYGAARLEEVQEIRRREVPEGEDMARWALAWCLRHPAVTAVIPGCKDPDQVARNAAAAG